MHWVSPASPFTPLPLELFLPFRYEPRLVARLLSGEDLGPQRPLADLDLARPQATITDVAFALDGSRATVTVELASDDVSRQDAAQAALRDVLLFRDGQWVASADGAAVDANGRFVFRGVKLPAGAAGRSVTFSSYALSPAGIKGPTDRRHVTVPVALPSRKGTAYIVTIGVNVYENRAWDLRYAVNDAGRLGDLMPKLIAGSQRFDRTVNVALLSEQAGGGPSQPTKEAIRRVLARLAGDRDLRPLEGVPGADQLRETQPEDLVVITFSGHGYRSADGLYYLFPYDIGANVAGRIEDMLPQCISTDELANWLRGVDGRGLVLIIDACHSAAAFETPGFKPGPMGSRGLGQLAYNKGAQILAASQAGGVAIETDRTRMGLLTYALVEDAPRQAQGGSHSINDMSLRQWLEYAVERVPSVHLEALAAVEKPGAGKIGRGLTRVDKDPADAKVPTYQRPVLFDFTTKSREIPLIPGYRTNLGNSAAKELAEAEAHACGG